MHAVIAGLVPAIHVSPQTLAPKASAWMRGTSPRRTTPRALTAGAV